jgi:hypothetical protein
MGMERVPAWHCGRCGETHDELPFSYAVVAPVAWETLPPEDQAERGYLDEELCVIRGVGQFIRGRVLVPLHGGPVPFFEWSVWVSLSEANFRRALDLWTTQGREAEPPYFGWFSCILPYSPPTLNLKCMVHTGPVGQRPAVELEPTDHPLAVEQRDGITMLRVQEFAELEVHQLS